jgi:hypothetical protein
VGLALLVLYVDQIGLRHRIIYVHAPVFIILFESKKQARLSGNKVNAIDMIVDLIQSQLSQYFDPP